MHKILMRLFFFTRFIMEKMKKLVLVQDLSNQGYITFYQNRNNNIMFISKNVSIEEQFMY